ncbi:MAG: alpha/beta hydrolase [Candidatus Krumholzibacteriota bacterium]|nr:alpha/beta hydrolase [Candidatus Krumholzibacteriota bacterium]
MKLIFLIAFGGYALVCAIVFLIQARLVYFPNDEEAGTPADAGMEYRDVYFDAGRHQLHGWFVPAQNARYTLLYCHGNAGNITHRVELVRAFVERGLSVFIFDYSGYGKSEGRVGEAETYRSAHAAWDYLTGDAGIDEQSIIIFGRSLGSAVAIELATQVSPRALILESSFTSLPDLGARAYPFLPVRLLSRFRYNSIDRIQDIRVPKLFVHSLDDDLVPLGMGKRLYRHASRPKVWTRAQGDHNAIYLVAGSRYEETLREFIASLGQPGRIVD